MPLWMACNIWNTFWMTIHHCRGPWHHYLQGEFGSACFSMLTPQHSTGLQKEGGALNLHGILGHWGGPAPAARLNLANLEQWYLQSRTFSANTMRSYASSGHRFFQLLLAVQPAGLPSLRGHSVPVCHIPGSAAPQTQHHQELPLRHPLHAQRAVTPTHPCSRLAQAPLVLWGFKGSLR